MSTSDHVSAEEPVDVLRPDDVDADPREDIEALCLCALLWAPADTAARAVAIVETTDFHRPLNAELYGVIAALVREGAPHGAAMVATALERDGELAGHHGIRIARALTDIATAGADPVSLGYYAKAVVTRAYRRGYHEAAQSMAQAAAELPDDQLFDHLLAIGRERRTASRRLIALRAAEI